MLVSLGGMCDVAWQIENFVGRPQWGPFNGLCTPLQSIPKILEERFESITDEKYLEFVSNTYQGRRDTSILNTHYQVLLHHEFTRDASDQIPDNWRDEIGRIAARWKFALERWYATLSKTPDITFVRRLGNLVSIGAADQPTYEADYLSTLATLRTYWPTARLAVVNPGFAIESPELKTANIRMAGPEDWADPADYWKGAPNEWKPFLQTLE